MQRKVLRILYDITFSTVVFTEPFGTTAPMVTGMEDHLQHILELELSDVSVSRSKARTRERRLMDDAEQ